MKFTYISMLAGVSTLVLSSAAYAQPAEAPEAVEAQSGDDTSDESGEEIIVQARRRSESLQDVPSTVNVATQEDLAKLNIRQFEDVQNIVPGLTLGGAGAGLAGAGATLRGVNFSTFASGNNGTVQFYLNEAAASPQNVFGQMFDIGQIEVLRGPQGTLRGRSSPSGSITVTTRRPTMDEWGGYVNATGTANGAINLQGAVNIPLIPNMLAVRIAGLYDENELDRVRSINNPRHPNQSVRAQRITGRFEPTDNFSIIATYLHLDDDRIFFDQVESARILDPLALASPVFIEGKDRLSVEDGPQIIDSQRRAFNLQVQYSLFGQRLNYVGAWDRTEATNQGVSDVGNFFGPGSAPILNTGYGQVQDLFEIKERSHELRLSSEERIAGIFDYVVGALYLQQIPTTIFRNPTVIITNPVNFSGALIVNTPLERFSETKEKSFFGNVTAHIGDNLELSGGLRRIDYTAVGGIIQAGSILAPASTDDHFKATIYMASAKYEFSNNLMVYAMTGSSWRPGVFAVGDFSVNQSALEQSFLRLDPETSKSYEIGVKSSPFKGARLNATVFYQKFKNSPYRSAGVFFVNSALPGPVETVSSFNFVAAVPITVKGVELEAAYSHGNFEISGNASYAKGIIKNGLIPCNDLNGDGIPDNLTSAPSLAVLKAAVGADNLSACRVTQRANNTPLFTASLQSEYHMPISNVTEGFLRGQVSYFGKSQGDPTNSNDQVSAYALLNLYLGVRAPDGDWEVSLYGKNILNTYRITTRGQNALSTGYRLGANALNGLTGYRGINSTAPREFGLNARFAFGSK